MEAMLKPMKWSDFQNDQKMGFKLFRTPGVGWFMISVMNMFLSQLLPQMIVRKMAVEEKNIYETPYRTISSRKPVRQWPLEIPIDGQPSDVHEVISNYCQKLQETELPKLLFAANPGAIIDSQYVNWCQQNLKNLKIVDIGEGLHFIQEDNPHMIGEELAKWVQEL